MCTAQRNWGGAGSLLRYWSWGDDADQEKDHRKGVQEIPRYSEFEVLKLFWASLQILERRRLKMPFLLENLQASWK